MRLRFSPEDTTPGLYHGGEHGPPAVSPDGRIVAFALGKEDTTALYVQPLDRFEQWSVSGGGRMPFFSPDGKWIGFMRGGSVWKVPSVGGTPTRLGSVDAFAWNVLTPGVWHPNGQIYFATTVGLRSLPASGGTARTVLRTDSASTLGRIGRMSLTPDARLLVTIFVGDSARSAVVSPEGGGVGFLPADILLPQFVGEALVFGRERQLYASGFDLGAQRLTGEPIAITDLVTAGEVSSGATAAWFDATISRSVEAVWVNRRGAVASAGVPPAAYRWPRLSPDARRLSVWSPGAGPSITVVDLASGTRSRLPAPGGFSEPVWFRDGSRVVMSGQTAGPRYTLISERPDGSGVPDTLLVPSRIEAYPTDMSPGDSLVLYYGNAPAELQNVFVLDLRTKKSRRITARTEQRGARFSPDGRWIALQSLDGARQEIIVLPWPALDAQHVVSTEGGVEPAWSADGRELYFRIGGRMFVVKVTAGATWSSTPPTELFRGPFASDPFGDQSYDVAPDGRFLMLRYAGGARPQLRVIHNWAAELKRKLAEAQRK